MKKDLDNITKLGPEVRFQRLNSFLNTIKRSEAAREDFNNWQMEIDDMLKIKGNVLRKTRILFGNEQVGSLSVIYHRKFALFTSSILIRRIVLNEKSSMFQFLC